MKKISNALLIVIFAGIISVLRHNYSVSAQSNSKKAEYKQYDFVYLRLTGEKCQIIDITHPWPFYPKHYLFVNSIGLSKG